MSNLAVLNAFESSPLGDMYINPVSVEGVGNNPLLPFFGPPLSRFDDPSPDDYASRETFEQADAYAGRSLFFLSTIDYLITKKTEWPMRELMPWRHTDQHHIQWNVWHFDKTLADLEPEQAPPRLVTSRKEEHRASTQRHGLAVLITDDFWKTAEGVMSLVYSVLNIRNSVIATVIFEIFHELLFGKQYYLDRLRKYGGPHPSVEQAFAFNNWRWGIVQKETTGDGLLNVIQEYRKLMTGQNVEPNIMVGTQGMAKFVTRDPSQRRYDLQGPAGPATKQQGESRMLDTTYQGMLYREFSPMEVDFLGGNAYDIMTRTRQIGSFYVMTEFNPQCDPRTYTSVQRDIFIFNMDTAQGEFSKITLKAALDNCGRFDSNGNLLRTHRELIAELDDLKARLRLTPPAGFVDMFLVKDDSPPGQGGNHRPENYNGYRLVRVNGEMPKPCARLEDIERMAESADATFSRAGFSPADRGAIEEGIKLSQRLYNADLFDRNTRAFLYAVVRQNDTSGDNSIEVSPDPLNVGSADLPYWIDPRLASGWVEGGLQGPPSAPSVKYLAVRNGDTGQFHRIIHLRPFEFTELNFPPAFGAANLNITTLNTDHPALDAFVLENELRELLESGRLFPSVSAAGAAAIAAVYNYLVNPANAHVIAGPFEPYGFGGFTGMRALRALSQRGQGAAGTRNYDPEILRIANRYVSALAKYTQIAYKVFPNNPMMDQRYCPFYAKTGSTFLDQWCTFVDGMFTPNYLPAMLKTTQSLQDELLLQLGSPAVSAAVLSRLETLRSRVPQGPDLSRLPRGKSREEAILEYRAEVEAWRDEVEAQIGTEDEALAASIRDAAGAVLDSISGVGGPGSTPAAPQERPIADEIVDTMITNLRAMSRFPAATDFSDTRLATALRLLYKFGSHRLREILKSPAEFTRLQNAFNSNEPGSLGSLYYSQHEPPLTARTGKNKLRVFLMNEVFDPVHPTGLKFGDKPELAANLLSQIAERSLNPDFTSTGDMSSATIGVLRANTVEGGGVDVSISDVRTAIDTGELEPPAGADPISWANAKLQAVINDRVNQIRNGRRAQDAAVAPESASLLSQYFHSRLYINPATFHRLARELQVDVNPASRTANAAAKRAMYRKVSIALPMNREKQTEPLGLARTRGERGVTGAERFGVQQEVDLENIAWELSTAATWAEKNDNIFHAPIGIRNLGAGEVTGATRKRGADVMGGGIFGRRTRQKTERGMSATDGDLPPETMLQQGSSPFVRQEMHDGGLHFYFAANAVDRWRDIARTTKDMWLRIPAQLWVVEPVNYHSFAAKIRHNVILLADFLLEQPFQEYQMAPIILAQGGASLGYVWYGNEDFQWGDNVVTKVHVGHFTMNWRAVPHNAKAYIVITDAYGVGYVGGEGVEFFDPTTFNPRARTLHKQGSILCFMEPYRSLRDVRDEDRYVFGVPNPHDVTGRWNPAVVGPLLDSDNSVDFKKPHHPSAFYYNKLYKLDRIFPRTPGDDLSYGKGMPHINTVTYQGMEWFYNPATCSYSNAILNTGPWGPNVYQGAKQNRIGLGGVLKDQEYEKRLNNYQ